jgi:hypothetical protein
MFDTYKVDRADLWAAMDAAGVVSAVVEFSGGNDEGGTDRVELDGKECTDYKSPLCALLARLPHERYYSFAGDYEVHGRIMVDRAAMTVMMEGQESATTWDGTLTWPHSFETEL